MLDQSGVSSGLNAADAICEAGAEIALNPSGMGHAMAKAIGIAAVTA